MKMRMNYLRRRKIKLLIPNKGFYTNNSYVEYIIRKAPNPMTM